jgi:hypothetical protein
MVFVNVITQPIDNIRRLQMVYSTDPKFAGVGSTLAAMIKKLYHAQGVLGFFSGADAYVFIRSYSARNDAKPFP